MRDIGGGASHVKADHLLDAGHRCRARHADNATGRAAQNRVLAGKGMGVGQATGGLHEKQLDARHLLRHLLHIAFENRRQVGVHHGRVATAHQFHHRAGLMRGADLRKADLRCDAPGRQFVCRVAIAVHEDNGDRTQTALVLRQQFGLQLRLVKRLDHIAVRTAALPGFDHRAVQQFRQHDVAVKDTGPVLVRNAQCVPKTLGGHQQRRFALALQQRVGGHRGPHLHAGHLLRRNRLTGLQTQQVPDAGHSCVAVLLGVLAQQFVRDQRAIRSAPHHVGECAATVNPELPAWR